MGINFKDLLNFKWSEAVLTWLSPKTLSMVRHPISHQGLLQLFAEASKSHLKTRPVKESVG